MEQLANELLTHWYRLALAVLEGHEDIAADAQEDVFLCISEYTDDLHNAFERLARARGSEESDDEWVADALEDIHILLEGKVAR